MPIVLVLMFWVFSMNSVQAKVTSYQRYQQMDEELGKKITSCLFNLDNGKKMAVCIERSRMTPGAGSQTGNWEEMFNDDLRKVLYYGYGGPEDKGYTVVETSCAAAASNGDNETSIGTKVLEEIRLLELPPPNFRVWKVYTNDGFTQDLAFFTTLTTGELNLEKTSTDNNYDYTLEGAVYGVFSDEACSLQVAELVTDADGKSETVSLDEGTYFVKELVAPEGYYLNEEVLKVNILVERTVTLVVSDEPIPPLTDLVVKKVNVLGESLKGAEFEIYEDEACTQLVGKGATDENGKVVFQKLIKENTYYLKEIKAPDGYMLSSDVHSVVADGTEIPVVNEKIFVLPNTGSVVEGLIYAWSIGCVIKSFKKER